MLTDWVIRRRPAYDECDVWAFKSKRAPFYAFYARGKCLRSTLSFWETYYRGVK